MQIQRTVSLSGGQTLSNEELQRYLGGEPVEMVVTAGRCEYRGPAVDEVSDEEMKERAQAMHQGRISEHGLRFLHGH